MSMVKVDFIELCVLIGKVGKLQIFLGCKNLKVMSLYLQFAFFYNQTHINHKNRLTSFFTLTIEAFVVYLVLAN